MTNSKTQGRVIHNCLDWLFPFFPPPSSSSWGLENVYEWTILPFVAQYRLMCTDVEQQAHYRKEEREEHSQVFSRGLLKTKHLARFDFNYFMPTLLSIITHDVPINYTSTEGQLKNITRANIKFIFTLNIINTTFTVSIIYLGVSLELSA